MPERLRLLREQRRELDVRPVHAPRRAHREAHQLAHLAEAARDRHLQPPAALERGVEVGAHRRGIAEHGVGVGAEVVGLVGRTISA